MSFGGGGSSKPPPPPPPPKPPNQLAAKQLGFARLREKAFPGEGFRSLINTSPHGLSLTPFSALRGPRAPIATTGTSIIGKR